MMEPSPVVERELNSEDLAYANASGTKLPTDIWHVSEDAVVAESCDSESSKSRKKEMFSGVAMVGLASGLVGLAILGPISGVMAGTAAVFLAKKSTTQVPAVEMEESQLQEQNVGEVLKEALLEYVPPPPLVRRIFLRTVGALLGGLSRAFSRREERIAAKKLEALQNREVELSSNVQSTSFTTKPSLRLVDSGEESKSDMVQEADDDATEDFVHVNAQDFSCQTNQSAPFLKELD